MNNAIKLFKIRGIDIKMHVTFPLILIWAAVSFGYFRNAGLEGAAYGVLVTLLVFLIVVLHELGHSLAALHYNIPVKQIILLPIGGVAQLEEIPELADAPPAGDLLGLDAEGGAGADGFGLIARKGGRGLLSGAGDPNVVYATQLQRLIEEALAADEKTRSQNYSVIARVWVGFDGSVTRAELASSTGEDEIDDSLIELINQLPALAEAPPPNMPQPIRMRISSRL